MIGMAGARVLRPFGGALVEALWSAALEPRGPLLPRAIDMVRDGLFAVDRGRPAGFGQPHTTLLAAGRAFPSWLRSAAAAPVR
jgi:hypothetical protein